MFEHLSGNNVRNKRIEKVEREWSGSPDPRNPDNYWIDDATGERVNAYTGERTAPKVD